MIVEIIAALYYMKTIFLLFKPSNPIILAPIFTFDICMLYFTIWNSVRTVQFMLHSLFVVTLVICGHLVELNRMLAKLVEAIHHRPFYVCAKLAEFQLEHHKVSFDMMAANQRLISPVFFVTLLTNIPLNINLVTVLLLRNLQIQDSALLASIAFLQICFTICGIQGLIVMVNYCHSPGANLAKLQLRMINNSCSAQNLILIRSKLKLMTYFHTEGKLYFTCGSLGSVSMFSFVKVIML